MTFSQRGVDRVYQVGQGSAHRAECGTCAEQGRTGVTAADAAQAWAWLNGHHERVVMPVLLGVGGGSETDSAALVSPGTVEAVLAAVLTCTDLPAVSGVEAGPLPGAVAMGLFLQPALAPTTSEGLDALVTAVHRAAQGGLDQDVAAMPVSGEVYERATRSAPVRVAWRAESGTPASPTT